MAYYYIFYIFYGFTDERKPVSVRVYKAGMALIMLEGWLLMAILLFTWLIIGQQTDDEFYFESFGALAVILTINTWCFLLNDRWKDYNARFDAWPDEKNDMGRKWVIMGSIAIIVLLGISVFAIS